MNIFSIILKRYFSIILKDIERSKYYRGERKMYNMKGNRWPFKYKFYKRNHKLNMCYWKINNFHQYKKYMNRLRKKCILDMRNHKFDTINSLNFHISEKDN